MSSWISKNILAILQIPILITKSVHCGLKFDASHDTSIFELILKYTWLLVEISTESKECENALITIAKFSRGTCVEYGISLHTVFLEQSNYTVFKKIHFFPGPGEEYVSFVVHCLLVPINPSGHEVTSFIALWLGLLLQEMALERGGGWVVHGIGAHPATCLKL